jgi:hypothetical protein
MNIGQKLHFDHNVAITLTHFASTAFYVERKMFGLQAFQFCRMLRGKQIANDIIRLDISNRIAAR